MYKLTDTPFYLRSLFLVASLFSSSSTIAQGTYAGAFKMLISKTYTDAKKLPELKSLAFHEASLISGINDPESITVEHFRQGNAAVIFFGINEDQNSEEYTIMDVLEVKNIPSGWEIKTAFCRQNKTENGEIVAMVKSTKEEILGPAKQAWRFNRDKRKIEAMDKQGIDCIGAVD